jgi:hypothetical protein
VRLGNEPNPGPGSLAGLLAGVAVGTASITLLFLGMRAVMAIGGACADGGPYVSARPCPTGVPLAMVAATFGLFASAGLILLFGSRFGGRWMGLPLLGWPALFISLGWNFLEFGLRPPGGAGLDWGWLIGGVVFVIMGAAPLAVVVLGWRATKGDSAGVRRVVASGLEITARRAPLPPPPDRGGDDILERLERLADLHRRGDLSDEEFGAAKRRLLGEPGASA